MIETNLTAPKINLISKIFLQDKIGWTFLYYLLNSNKNTFTKLIFIKHKILLYL